MLVIDGHDYREFHGLRIDTLKGLVGAVKAGAVLDFVRCEALECAD